MDGKCKIRGYQQKNEQFIKLTRDSCQILNTIKYYMLFCCKYLIFRSFGIPEPFYVTREYKKKQVIDGEEI